MTRPHILLFGATGLLGSEVQRQAPNRVRLTVPERDTYDFVSSQSVEDCVKRHRPTHVINCAAMTNVDACESAQDRCFLVNGYAPGAIARACREIGARMVQMSTDFVFDGKLVVPHRYHHSDPATNPGTVYGRAKLMAEEQVLDAGCDALVIRSSWLFGGVRPTFPDWVMRQIDGGGTVELPTDRLGSPTYAPDLAKAVRELTLSEHFCILHVTNAQESPVSQIKYGEACGNDFPSSFRASTQAEILKRGDWKVRRPTNTALRSDIPLRDWREALQHYLDLKLSVADC